MLADKSFVSQIIPVQLDDVQGAQEHLLAIAPVADQVEAGDAIRPAGDRFAIDDAGPRSETPHRLDNAGEAPGQVIAR
jgi:hypothetical protein